MEQKPSLRERLEAARQQRRQSQAIQAARQELQEANEGLGYSKDFFEVLALGDGLGIEGLRALGYPRPTAVATWLNKSWEDWLKEMRSFSTYQGNKGKAAQEILAVVEPLNENETTREVLSGYFAKVVRPSQNIYRREQFDSFLWSLTAEGLAAKHLKQPAFGRNLEWKKEWYGPSSGLRISGALWSFVERAKRRVERYSEVAETILPRLEPLKAQASFEDELELQNLHRLITHVEMVGLMLVWEARTQVRGEWDAEAQRHKLEEAGLLAILIGRFVEGSSLVIGGWEADKPLPFPKEAVELPGFDINFTVTGAIASIAFRREALQDASQKEREGWRRIQWLMNRWLNMEGRYYIPALPKSQEGSST